MAGCLDFLKFVTDFGSKGVVGCSLGGYITGVANRPVDLMQNVVFEPGTFYHMEIFVVSDMDKYISCLEDNGVVSEGGNYLVNGSVLIYASGLEVGEWYKVTGTVRYNVKNKYMYLFPFYKENNIWHMRPCKSGDLDISGYARSSQCYNIVINSWKAGKAVRTDSVNVLPRFKSEFGEETEIFVPEKTEYSVPETTVGTGIVKLANRKEVLPTGKGYKKFEDRLKVSSKFNSYMKQQKESYGGRDANKYIKRLVNNMITYYKRKPGNGGMTGRALLKKYLSNFPDSGKRYLGKSVSNYLADIFVQDISQSMLDSSVQVPVSGVAAGVYRSAFRDKDKFYGGVVASILSLSFEDMMLAVQSCAVHGFSLAVILNENPYLLRSLCDLSFDDIELVAVAFDVNNESSLDAYRNMAMLDSYVEDKNYSDTVRTKDNILKDGMGVTITEYRYNLLRDTGTVLRSNVIGNMLAHVGVNTGTYNINDFRKRGSYYKKSVMVGNIGGVVRDYVDSGLGVECNGYVTSVDLLRKELFVYDAMFSLGSQTYNYSQEDMDKYIAEYEDKVGFKLEPLQREAVYLLNHGGFVVTGSAGSGKTTVSSCILYVLEKLESDLRPFFCAPTGKAAKRMQEVVHRPARTLHSQFKVGLSNNEVKQIGVFFIDEGAMVTLDLMYKVLQSIDLESSRVFFFGDIWQLPPIGKGLPFRDMLGYMPCVSLEVSKRAAEGSDITRNSNYILKEDTPLEDCGDFHLVKTEDGKIQTAVFDLCKELLSSGIAPSNIQVVTPLAKAAYEWGSTKLNECLQPLFNTNRDWNRGYVYKSVPSDSGVRFMFGDRVIHTSKNMYSMQWYTEVTPGVYQKACGSGICNGEVGELMGVYSADIITILDEPNGDSPTEMVRDDTTFCGDDRYFVAVKYFDYITDSDFVILYRAESLDAEKNGMLVLTGNDLSKLALFYAGTVHKMQGSQAKVIVGVLGNVPYKGFITRQMVYTMVTRGIDEVYLVGSVGNEVASMLSKARRDIATSDTITVGGLIT